MDEIEIPPRPGDPSPEEIRQRCLEIQAEWTPAERRRRWQHHSPGWLPPGALKHAAPVDVLAKERGWSTRGELHRAHVADAGDDDEEPEDELTHGD